MAWILGVMVVVPLACSSGEELFGGGVTDGSTSASTGAGANTTSSVAEANSVAATSASTGGAGPGASSTAEASSTASGAMVEIPCTNQTCTTGQVCCVHNTSPSLDQCQSPGQCGDGFTEVGCNGPNDCLPNEVCCGHFLQGQGYEKIECVTTCGNSGMTTGLLMCGDEPSICQPNMNCFQSQYLPTDHGYCG